MPSLALVFPEAAGESLWESALDLIQQVFFSYVLILRSQYFTFCL